MQCEEKDLLDLLNIQDSLTTIYVSFVRNSYLIHAPTSIISVNVNVFRGFCCPFPEGRGG